MSLSVVPKPRLQFDDISNNLNAVLFQPDVQAFRIVLCAVAAHTLKPHGYPPVWLMIIAPSGSGKTTLIDLLNSVPHVVRINDLTPKTFLSGLTREAGKSNSLLHRLGTKPIITMKDFTTIISKRAEDKSEIIGQLREIYDGYYHKETGSGKTISWSGRLTLLTCCTPDGIDSDRMTFRVMGDRFMEVRCPGPPSEELARRVVTQADSPDFKPLQAKIFQYLENCSTTLPKYTPQQSEQLTHLSRAVAWLRTPVLRDLKGYKIVDVGTPESPTRIAQALTSVVISSAALDNAPMLRNEDMDLAIRMAHSSIPKKRLHILSLIQAEGLSKSDPSLEELPTWTKDRAIEDLQALDLIEVSKDSMGDDWYHFTEKGALFAHSVFSTLG